MYGFMLVVSPVCVLLQSQRTQKKDFGKGKRSDEWTDYRNRNTTWENIDEKAKEGSLNQEFEDYYKEQNVCPEKDWNEFMHTLREPLPIAFRINGSGKFSEQLKERLQNDFFSKFSDGKIIVEGITPRFLVPHECCKRHPQHICHESKR